MIVVFGSLNIDLVFPVRALPRPGETALADTYQRAAGGKGGNQAAAAALAGAECRMVGCVGDDEFGNWVLARLASANVDVGAVARVAAPTGCAAVAVDSHGGNQIIVASGANLELDAAQVPDDWLGTDTTLVMQFEVPLERNWALARRARARNARLSLNAAPAQPIPGGLGALFDVLIVNEHEAAAVAADLRLTAATAEALLRGLAARYETRCIMTLGAQGALAAGPQGLSRIGALEVRAVDTTAAGDAFVGAYAAALDRGLDADAALHRASIAGGLACTKAGALPSIPAAGEVEAHLNRLAPPIRIGE